MQIKYSFEAYQKSQEEVRKIQEALNDKTWRPQPLHVVNVSISYNKFL